MALGSVGWLRTLGCIPMDFGANQVVQPWQAAPQAAAYKPGCLGLVKGQRETCSFCSWLYFLSDIERIL